MCFAHVTWAKMLPGEEDDSISGFVEVKYDDNTQRPGPSHTQSFHTNTLMEVLFFLSKHCADTVSVCAAIRRAGQSGTF